MNILQTLINRVSLAKGRDYLTGAEIAEDTLKHIVKEGFEIYAVTKTRFSSDRTIESVEVSNFMNAGSAIKAMETESRRLESLNPKYFLSIQDDGKFIEIENTRKGDAVVYTFRLDKAEVG